MTSTHEVDLNLPFLPAAASQGHLFPSHGDTSLLSLGQLCDHGCTATFSADNVTVHHSDRVVLQGSRSAATNGLWHVQLPILPPPPGFAALAASNSPADLVAFAHGSLFSPSLSTLQQALDRGYISNFPGVSSALLKKHPPQSVATAKGHLDQIRKNRKSTQPKPHSDSKPQAPPNVSPALPVSAQGVSTNTQKCSPNLDPTTNPDLDTFPQDNTTGDVTDHCYAAVMDSTGQVFTDQTGRFILPSSQGSTQLLILYCYDANYIHAEPMKNKTATSILNAYKAAHAVLVASGLKPKLQRLDNEASTILKDFLSESDIDFQLAPPGIHRRNAAERAIRTFKNHFIAGLSTTDPLFPLHLWCRLLPQAILTLNLLRGSRINPKLSAWAQVHGQFDFNRTPIAPPGIHVVVHEKPDKRGSWAPHGVDGWYIGPAMDSYRCYRTYVWKTQAERISDTLAWFPCKLAMPGTDSTSLIAASLRDILHALQNPSPGTALAPIHTQDAEKLKLLATLFDVEQATTTNNQPTTTKPTPEPVRPSAPLAHLAQPAEPAPTTAASPVPTVNATNALSTPTKTKITTAPTANPTDAPAPFLRVSATRGTKTASPTPQNQPLLHL